jgi:hypothetical protein
MVCVYVYWIQAFNESLNLRSIHFIACMLRSPVESYSLQIKNKVPNLVANLQGMLVGLGISGSGSIKRKETWRQQFESAPGYFCSLSP